MNWFLLARIVGIVAVVAFILGIIARVGVSFPLDITASAFLRFTNTLLFFAIAFLILDFRQRRTE